MNDVERLARVLQAMDYDDEWVRVGVRMARGSCWWLKSDVCDRIEAWADEADNEVDPVIDSLTVVEEGSFHRLPYDLASRLTDWNKAVIAAVARRDGDAPYDIVDDAIGQLMEEYEKKHPRRHPRSSSRSPQAELVTTVSTDEQARLERITGVPAAASTIKPSSNGELQDTLCGLTLDWCRETGLRGGALRSAQHWLDELSRDVGIDTPVRAITPRMVAPLIAPHRSKEMQRRADRARKTLREFFAWCVTKGYLDRSPLPNEAADSTVAST